MDRFPQFIESPLFWGFIGLIFTALAISGRLSVTAARVCLILAWIVATIFISKFNPFPKLSRELFILAFLLILSGVGFALYPLYKWVGKANIPSIEKEVEYPPVVEDKTKEILKSEQIVKPPEKKVREIESEQQIAAIQSLAHEIDVNDQMINTAIELAKRWPTRSEKENFSYASYHELPIAIVVATGALKKNAHDREMLENLDRYQQAINEFNNKLRIVGRHNPGIFIKVDLIHVREPKQWPSRIDEILAEPFQNLLHAHKTARDLLWTRYPVTSKETLTNDLAEKRATSAQPTDQKKTSQTALENIEKMIKYEYTPRFQIEDENMSYASSDAPIAEKVKRDKAHSKWPSRWFSYDAVLHNVGARVLNVSAVHLCILKPDEKGCPRSFHVASEFLLESGGKQSFAFNMGQGFISDTISELENVELVLQIEYITPDRTVSAYRKKIGGFKGEAPVMHIDVKMPKQD